MLYCLARRNRNVDLISRNVNLILGEMLTYIDHDRRRGGEIQCREPSCAVRECGKPFPDPLGSATPHLIWRYREET